MWTVNKPLLNNPWVTEEVLSEIKYTEQKQMEKTAYHNFYDS